MNIQTSVAVLPRGIAIVVSLCMPMASAQKTNEITYTVQPRAMVSVTNAHGPITVKPSGSRQVVVRATRSGTVTFENERHGNRIELRSRYRSPGDGFAEYIVLVPGDSWVILRSSTGTLHAERLDGDIVLEGTTSQVEITDIRDAHIHVKTLSGPITLTAIRNSHLDVRSISGDVSLHDVTGSSVEVDSGGGRITYEGDPGPAGEYLFTSRFGNLDISIPANVAVEIMSRSMLGDSRQGANGGVSSPTGRGNLLLNPGLVSRSRFVLRSFRGKINIKRP